MNIRMMFRIPQYVTLLGVLSVQLLSPQLGAQSAEKVANYFKQNPEADMNGDGKLTLKEAREHRQKRHQLQSEQNNAERIADLTRGDNLASTSHIAGITISESVSPIVEVPLKSSDGLNLGFFYRKPKGDGPFPVILFFHGGGVYAPQSGLKNSTRTGTVQTRFLKEGFAIVQSTRRSYWKTEEHPNRVGFFDAVTDATLVIEKVKTLPGIDSAKMILYGGSGGGILAISAASENEVLCVVAGEPATVLLLAPASKERPSYSPIMQDPLSFYNGKSKKTTRALLKNINSPILLLQGDINNNLNKINNQLLIPELKSLKKNISSKRFPGLGHGFYWGTTKTGVTLEIVEQIVKEVIVYIGNLNE